MPIQQQRAPTLVWREMTGASYLEVLLGPWRPAIDALCIDPEPTVQIMHQQQKGQSPQAP
jgi:hypothetical protein